jgi:hypothetical protein
VPVLVEPDAEVVEVFSVVVEVFTGVVDALVELELPLPLPPEARVPLKVELMLPTLMLEYIT